MNKLRESLASSSAQAAAMWRAPAEIDEGTGRSAAATQFSNARRRLTQGMMERFGKAQASDDGEYDARKARVLEYGKILSEVRVGAGKWLDAARAQAHTGGEGIAKAIHGTYGIVAQGQRGGSDPGAEAAQASARGVSEQISVLDGEARTAFDNAFIRDVLLPLDTLQAESKALQIPCRERELLKLDYDARERAVDSMKTVGSGPKSGGLFGSSKPQDPSKVLHKEEKLERTKNALDESTAILFERFDSLERTRYGSGDVQGHAAPGSLPYILQSWLGMQHTWSLAVAEQLSTLASVPPGHLLPGLDPPAVYGKTGVCYGPVTVTAGGEMGNVSSIYSRPYPGEEGSRGARFYPAPPTTGGYGQQSKAPSSGGGMAAAMAAPVGYSVGTEPGLWDPSSTKQPIVRSPQPSQSPPVTGSGRNLPQRPGGNNGITRMP